MPRLIYWWPDLLAVLIAAYLASYTVAAVLRQLGDRSGAAVCVEIADVVTAVLLLVVAASVVVGKNPSAVRTPKA